MRYHVPEYVDVLVIGAGLSGIGAAYRLQTECPDRTYVIVEAREMLGGTWDLFRYPGVRSDSDMYTLGYPFKPWRAAEAIASGPAILDYIRETAVENGIDRKIVYRTRVTAADWSTADRVWTVTLEQGGTTRTVRAGFLYACAGYYDYDHGHAPEFPGADSFAGRFVHPQFWPQDLAYAGKRVVIIGSGATAVTLVPAMASADTHVTMLQRSPTWISAVPSRDRQADWLRTHLPERIAHRAARVKNVVFNIGFQQYCERFPDRARAFLLGRVQRVLGAEAVEQHFTPAYRPWEQRLCAAPGADIFKAIKAGHAEVVTDTIAEIVPAGIRLTSGRVLEADIIVGATGLELTTFGGLAVGIDGRPVNVADEFVWRGAMVSGIPNFAFCIGYSRLSWTLRADLSSRLVCKVLNWMAGNGIDAVVPEADKPMAASPLFGLTSGYIRRSVDAFPKQGSRAPWQMRQNYLLDAFGTLRNDFGRTLRPVSGVPASGTAGEADIAEHRAERQAEVP
ncbi:flavin-containing monooxygenase [Skermania piniformis]|uniref:NAD(P)/FAD-dependent oxidoreductase n=1 Tax=Skermania pinensis TaxID=39122 RepID=A0ABX8S840_9ACTN|nr:NAD(P)/FAD-dependent oxidoreductase [Skermania piniformis]QXQ13933.1 NAD(P)/FAD-dependent oxidoreductase [Skermania piniformis]